MDVCKCTVPLWHEGTLNSCRAASPFERLVEWKEASDTSRITIREAIPYVRMYCKKDFNDDHREEITDFVQSIIGFQELDEDVETWIACDAEDCGFQILNDDEIVTSVHHPELCNRVILIFENPSNLSNLQRRNGFLSAGNTKKSYGARSGEYGENGKISRPCRFESSFVSRTVCKTTDVFGNPTLPFLVHRIAQFVQQCVTPQQFKNR
ncbi:uncharacterized protein TNCV_3629481 [Trichonephila clavipes]|nr:uncharacterized protein TNCV_3629481 [Trichonephila clavipes]